MHTTNTIALFDQKTIRKVWHNDEWFFSIVDVVWVLTDSTNPTDYLKKIRKRDPELASYIGTNCPQVEVLTESGKKRKTLVGNTEHILRLIQSIPSPNAEPFKRRLAKVWYERIEEIENPELAQERMKQLFEAKWYPQDRIDKRLRGIAIRQNLTDEWKSRGISEHKDYAILTAEISKATFGMTPSEYKKLKQIPDWSKANLRDSMTDLELIFSMLWERATTEITQTNNSQGIRSLKQDAKAWGTIAGDAKKALETKTGKKVSSKENYLIEKEEKRLK